MESLQSLRQQIDAIDAQLFEWIEKRAQLAYQIGQAKALMQKEAANPSESTASAHLLHPHREAELLRKLLAKPHVAASDTVIVQIWRELISESLRIQSAPMGGMHVLYDPKDRPELLMWARERFGGGLGLKSASSPQEIIQAARSFQNLGVLSLDERMGPWWGHLLAEPNVRIIAALPERKSQDPVAVAIGALRPEPTGHDLSYFVCEARLDPREVIESLSLKGLAASLKLKAQGLALYELLGFVQENDPRLQGYGSLSGLIGACALIYD